MRTLRELLTPVAEQTFFRDYYGRKAVKVVGSASRFVDLFSWRELNSVLAHHVLAPPRLQLLSNGVPLAVSAYTRKGAPSSFRSAVNHNLMNALHLGAVLCVGSADEFKSGLNEFARALESRLETEVYADLHAACNDAAVYPLRWHECDQFVLGLSGTTHWELHGESRRFPIDSNRGADIPPSPPITGPVEQFDLEAGGFLYVPRGTWFSVRFSGPPSLHVTIAIRKATGVNLCLWLVEMLKAQEIIRADVPFMADATDRTAYVQQVKAALEYALDDSEVLGDFFRAWNGVAASRPIIGLPHFAVPPPGDSASNQWVTLTSPRVKTWIEVPELGGLIRYVVDGQLLTFRLDARELLRFLLSDWQVPLPEFYDQFSSRFSVDELQNFLGELVKYGVVSITSQDRPYMDRKAAE